MQYQSDDQVKSELRPQLRRVLQNLEYRFEVKFTDLTLSAWVQALTGIPDDYLLITTIYVSATCSHLPTPYRFLEMYREKLKQAEEAKVSSQRLIEPRKDNSLDAQKEKIISKLFFKLRDSVLDGCTGKDFNQQTHDERHAEFFQDMRKLSFEHLENLDMQLPPCHKKFAWSKTFLG